MYTREHTETHRAWTQVDTGTHRHAGMQAKAVSPRDSCAHTSTRVNTRTDIRKRVCRPTPPQPTLEHLGATRWATRARRATRRAAHTQRRHARTSLHVDARIHTPRGCRRAYPHLQKYHPTRLLGASNHTRPSRVPAARPGRARWRSHTGPSRARPASPHPLALGPSPPTVLRSFPTIPSGALTCSGVAPGLHSVPAPRRAPARRLRTPRRPRLHNLEQVAAFPHFGGGPGIGVGGAGGAAA